jgi:hypothetical protein
VGYRMTRHNPKQPATASVDPDSFVGTVSSKSFNLICAYNITGEREQEYHSGGFSSFHALPRGSIRITKTPIYCVVQYHVDFLCALGATGHSPA